MPQPQFQGACVGENYLCVQRIAQADGAIDRAGLVIGDQCFGKAACSRQGKSQRVVENGGLAMIASRQSDALRDGFAAGVYRALQIAAGALQANPRIETLEPFLLVLMRK